MQIEHFRSLRTKILLAVALGMLTLLALIFFVARTVLLDGFTKLEKDKTFIQLDSAIELIKQQSEQLSTSVKDNAHWDEAYQFTVDKNPAFLKSNFGDTSFNTLKVNAIFIVNANGEVLYKKGVNYLNGKPWHIPDMLDQAVKKGGALTDPAKNHQSGLLWTPEGVCIVAAYDILTSTGKGPRHGALVMASLLNQPTIESIEKALGAKLSVEAITEDEIPIIFDQGNQKTVLPLANNQVGGFALIKPIGGDVKLLLSTAGDRKILEQGKLSLQFFYRAALLVALLLAAFSWLIDRLILKRLARLSENVKRIGESAVITERIEAIEGHDEMSHLALGINNMLQRLDESQYALEYEKERAQVTLAGIADAVITSDNKGCVQYMNAAAERLTGITNSEANGKNFQRLFHLRSTDQLTNIDSTWLTDATSNQDEVLLKRADGQTLFITKSASPLYNENMELFSTVTVLHDVTMLRSLSTQISYQARHDQLTGLVNRYEFERKLQEAIEDTTTQGRMYCLAYFDLDQFKIVNDTSGHSAGDMLLRELTSQLSAKVRSSDTLARLGGDEFALLLNGCNLDKAYELTTSLLQVVKDYRFTVDDKVFKVGASFGLTKISIDQTLTISELFIAVDSACYAAKSAGGNHIHIYQHDDNTLQKRNNQLDWVARINANLEKNQFVLFKQAFKSLSTQEKHCELLIRMKGDNNVLYPPSAFLPAAERYRLMPQIDRWVINEALSIIARKNKDLDTVYAINLSGQSLSQDGFLEYVTAKIKQYGVDTHRLCFEITETAVITNLNKAIHLMQSLRAIGCRFSLDDFGSGLSSFAYLKNLEVDFLKIDGMFVKSIASNKIDRAMVESINNVGHVMGLQTIAEFAENQEIIDVLKEIGVDYAQGYGVEMPALFA